MPKKSVKKALKATKEAPKLAEEELVGEPEEFLDEPDEHTDAHAEHVTKITAGEQEADVYTEEGRDELEESDAVAPWEEGFSEGADHGGSAAECAHCSKILGDRDEDEIIERKYKGDVMKFCSEKCAEAGPKPKGK